MYNRENIDPRYLGLHVHLGSVRMLKTQQTVAAIIERSASRSVRCNVTVAAIMRTEAATECYATLMSVECRIGVAKKRKLAIQSLRLLSDVIVVVAM